MVAVVFLWCQALEVVVVFWERPVAAVVGAAGGAALDCRVRGVVPRRRALGCDSAACFARPCPNNNSPDRSLASGPGAPRMRLFYISARARRTDGRAGVASVLQTLAIRFAQAFFLLLRDVGAQYARVQVTNTAPVLRAVNSAISACVKRLSRPKSSLGRCGLLDLRDATVLRTGA